MKALILHKESLSVSIAETAAETKAKALAEAATIQAIESEFEQDACVAALQTIQRLVKQVEDSRTSVKAPVLELGRTIDSTAKTFAADLEKEKVRLNKLLTAYTTAQREKAAAAERERQRIEAERAKAEAEAAAEAARIEAERQAAAEAEFLAESEEEAAAAEAKRKESEAALAATQFKAASVLKAAEAEKAALAPVEVTKPSGMSVREVWTFEVENIAEVYKAHPEFVELSILRSVVNRKLSEGLRECPGLRIWKETKTGVRA